MSERRDTQDQAEFREYCRRWLDENRPPAPGFRLPDQPACSLHSVEQITHMTARAMQQVSQFAEGNLLRLPLAALPQANELLLQT